MLNVDVAVVGAGIIGLATALQLQRDRPGIRIAILEKETGVARHQTEHNSGVIHSGIYYQPGSLKARLCVEGAQQLKVYCQEHDIPVRVCGKLIVATKDEELDRLAELERRGHANAVPGLQLLDREQLREIEPATVGIRALYSPYTAVVNYSDVATQYRRCIEREGATVLTEARLLGVQHDGQHSFLETEAGELKAGTLVNCAGLHSDRVFELCENRQRPVRIIPFRGEYYALKTAKQDMINGLIYPVPDPKFPFLGVHVSKTVAGAVECGPNAVMAWAREGYHRTTLNGKDIFDAFSYPGFWWMASKQWKVGAQEMWRSISKRAFLRALQRLVPSLEMEDLTAGGSGVRAQVVLRDGTLMHDFCIEEGKTGIHVLNAPSPGATGSLAIGQHIAKAVLKRTEVVSSPVPVQIEPSLQHV